jgi:class 3 adenylate cyclase
MVDAVFEYGGVLDKFLGDGLLAVYGSFGSDTDHPLRAVSTAIRMKARLAEINRKRAGQGLPAIKIGIGIHTDEVVVGNIGSQKRLEYTVIGDGVNVTSRLEALEALNKDFTTTIPANQPPRGERRGRRSRNGSRRAVQHPGADHRKARPQAAAAAPVYRNVPSLAPV